MAHPGVLDRPLSRRSRLEGPGEAAISVTLTEPPDAPALRSIRGIARYLEVRADLAGDLDPDALREGFEGRLVYSLRSVAAGGSADADGAERRRRLLAAAARYDLVDLEHDRDLDPDLLCRIPPARRRISWHGTAVDAGDLRARFGRMESTAARLYLLEPVATAPADGLVPLQLLAGLGRSDVTAFASGAAGLWSRLLAPRLGAPIAFGQLGSRPEAGMISADRLVADYGFPMMGRLRDLYGIVGGSVERSLAPRIYNRGFRALGLPALCLPFSASDFGEFWRDLVVGGLPELGVSPRALTVVTPHKEAALAVANLATGRAREAGAANSLVRAGGAWHGGTTTRLVASLADAGVETAGRSAAVVGCGGAGRTVAAELRRSGADVTLVNRGAPRGRYASELLGLPWIPLPDFSPAGFDLVVNATPLTAEAPFDPGMLADRVAVVDIVYRPDGETALVEAARRRGIVTVDGWRILGTETAGQFELMTGQPMPPDAIGIASGRNPLR